LGIIPAPEPAQEVNEHRRPLAAPVPAALEETLSFYEHSGFDRKDKTGFVIYFE